MKNTADNETFATITQRKSVRHYTGTKLNAAQLELLVKAGMAAPSANNVQPWHFIVITNDDTIKQLTIGLPYGKMLPQAGAAIVVCGIVESDDVNPNVYWQQDCSAATQNILLAAESLGYGAVWLGVYPREDRIAHVKNTLQIPDKIMPLNVLAVGMPVGDEKPKNKYKPNKIHWEKW